MAAITLESMFTKDVNKGRKIENSSGEKFTEVFQAQTPPWKYYP